MTQRTALITGASSGIGAATARQLVADGHRVVLAARRADRLEALVAELGDAAAAAPFDVGDPAAVLAAAERIGPIDTVIANAGVMLPGPIAAGDAVSWQRMLDANLNGLLSTVRAFVPGLVAELDAGRPADLIVTSSIASHVFFPGYAVYSATKAGATGLAAGIRAELAPRGLRVTTVEPGLTATELGSHIEDAGQRDVLAAMFDQIAALAPADIAEVIGFVLSRPQHVNLRHIEVLPTTQA